VLDSGDTGFHQDPKALQLKKHKQGNQNPAQPSVRRAACVKMLVLLALIPLVVRCGISDVGPRYKQKSAMGKLKWSFHRSRQ
jgi:hypothetical protein